MGLTDRETLEHGLDYRILSRREDVHLQRDVLLEALREHEVDELPGALLVLRAAQDPRELDLPEAAVPDDASWGLGGMRLAAEHLGRRAGGVGDDDRPLPAAPCST